MEKVIQSLSEESTERSNVGKREVWSEMFPPMLHCDVVLQTEDNGKFKVHRIVMSLCSQYFKVLFLTKLHTWKRNWFCILGVRTEVMSEIVKYAYSGWMNITEDNAFDLLIGADYLNVLGMLKDCCNFILSRINFKNCISIRKFGNHFHKELEEAAHRFLITYFVEVTEQSPEFLEMTLEEVVELLSSDRINMRIEEQVWEAGLRWVDHLPEERVIHIDSIMRSVRLGLLENSYFHNKVKNHTYVTSNDLCKPIVIETLKFLWDLENISQKTERVETPRLAIPRIPFSIIFAIGGWNGGSPTTMIETYDTKADRWIQIDATDPGGPRAYHKLAVIGYDIYVIGGFDGNHQFNSCRCFNAVTKEWRSIAPMHIKRCYVSVATLDGLIYAMGGFDGRDRHNTVERYDYHTNQWTFIAPMNEQRSDASASELYGFIYIVGGFSGSECLSSCEFYNPATDQWTFIPNMRQRRSGVSTIAYHGYLYAIGGMNGIARLMDGEKYDPETDQWSEVPHMSSPRSNFGIEVIDDMIFVLGGFNGVNTIFRVECFDDRKNEWLEATDMNTVRSALAACVVHGLPNVEDYVHQNRAGLVEEKRQRLLQQRAHEFARADRDARAGLVALRHPIRNLLRLRENAELD